MSHIVTNDNDIKLNSEEYIYVALNKCYGIFSLSDLALQFISKYRKVDANLCDIDGLDRHDPVLVLTILLLGKLSNNVFSSFKIIKLKVDGCQYYKIDDNSGEETITILNGGYTYIEPRPKNFLNKLTKYANSKNITLDFSSVKYFPSQGNYRIYD